MKLSRFIGISGFIIVTLFMFPTLVSADESVYANTATTSSQAVGSSTDHLVQTLGTGLSGQLTQIDLNTSNTSFIFYGTAPIINLYECDDDTYGNLNVNGSTSCTVIFSGVSDMLSQFFSSVQSFYPTSVTLNPNKYYFFATWGTNSFNTLPYYYGSSVDTVDGACYQFIQSLGINQPCPNVADLYFSLHGITKTVAPTGGSSVLFIPGIMGSQLYEQNSGSEDKLWVSTSDTKQADLALDTFGKSINSVYTKDDTQTSGESETGIVDEVSFLGSTVIAPNIYKSFINDLDKWKNVDKIISDYAFIPYDWRLSLNDIITDGASTTAGNLLYTGSQNFSDSYILKKLQELQIESPTHKVTIIAHSNGGLVVKALMQKLKDTNNPLYYQIDKIIFIAVPQVGTPDSIVTLLHGSSIFYGFVMFADRSRQLAENMPVVYNLLPSAGYFSAVDPAFAVDKVISFENNPLFNADLAQYGVYVSNQTELKNYILGTDGRTKPAFSDLLDPNIGNAALYTDAQNVHTMLDNWQPASTTEVIQVAGWGEETTAGLDYKTYYGNQVSYTIRRVIDGDGTVVTPSALWMSTSTPNVERWWVNLEEYSNQNFIDRKHKDILEISSLLDLIKSKIKNVVFSDPDNIVVNNTSTLVSTNTRLHYTLHSPLTLGITDSQGRYTGLDPVTKQIREEIPGVTYEQVGEVQFLSVPSDIDHTLTLKGYDAGSFSLDIDTQQGDTVTNITSFQGIPSSTSTIVTMNYSQNTNIASSTLNIDKNGDGVTDISLNVKLGGVVTLPKYTWQGFSQPINDTKYHPEQTASVFKGGSTVPIKFQLKNFNGATIQASTLPKFLPPEKLSALSATVTESTDPITATTGSDFKWDSTDQQYIYNWSTKGLASGYWYRISVKLDDNSTYSMVVGLR